MSDSKLRISETDYERMADALIHYRILNDPRYAHAEDAEDQARAEDEIAAEVGAHLSAKYDIK